MGKKKPTGRGDAENLSIAPQSGAGGGGKARKALVIDDDEYSVDTELSGSLTVKDAAAEIVPKKKEKKGNQKGSQKQLYNADEEEEGKEPEELLEVVFSGKKKAKGKKTGVKDGLFGSSNFAMLGNDDTEAEQNYLNGTRVSDDDDELVTKIDGRKKSSTKGGKKRLEAYSQMASAFDAIGDENDENLTEVEDEDNGEEIHGTKFSEENPENGVARESTAKKVTFDLISGLEEEEEDDGDDSSLIAFSGKKKKSSKSKKTSSKVTEVSTDEVEKESSVSESVKNVDNVVEYEVDETLISFTGKKKSSKKKNTSPFSSVHSDDVAELVNTAESHSSSNPEHAIDTKPGKEEVLESQKSKKKKKKSGRTVQEEDDLDKILAELGEAPVTSKSTSVLPQEETVIPDSDVVIDSQTDGDKHGEEGEEEKESAAAKKKKKKKEKEKEKKAAAAMSAAEKVEEAEVESQPKKSDVKGKAAEKKVPKHVREMQEAIARRKEMEERKAREEEEKRRKEEEERKRLEEIERLAEEAKRRKKEREKEKLLKKKQEGKLLTGKQKEEQKRLEAMRNQFLANAGVSIPSGEKDAVPKRPKYQTKKTKAGQQRTNGVSKVEESCEVKEDFIHHDFTSEVENIESDPIKDLESTVEEHIEDVNNVGEYEMDDDDEDWDAKSWDDVNIQVKGAFDDEEVEDSPEPTLKKEIKPHLAPKVPAKLAATTQKSVDVPNDDVEHPTGVSSTNVVSSESTKQSEILRSPICCIMGHVDTGKTKLLDCIRGTNVQEGEAGGITQQIGATYFPAENIRERTQELKADATLKVPGLLVIDTPGHESFTNLRSRGSGLCDIAILVVDIMHGLEPQTIESLNLLKLRNTEFIVALNKVDRLYGWKTCRNAPIQKALKQQSKDVVNEFNMRLVQIITQFKEQGLNTELYYRNKEMGETFSIVPTSAISGEGVPDMLLLLVHWTQKTMVKKLTYSEEVQCTVLEVKVIEGHGTTIDVVLVNGVLHEGDQIVICGLQGPIVTSIRALLTPHPMKELRVKGTYLHHKEIKAAQGIKITAQGLEHAIAGTGLYVVGPDDDVEDVKEAAMEDMKSVMSRIDKSGEGVYVQASTLGSLEALLEFLKTPVVNIPVSGIGIGPIHKKDVMKASVMLEKKKEYATILAFDVKVTPEARELADELGVTIFIADIIYHLFDQFKAYINNLKEEKKKEVENDAVFPCILKILPNCVFMKKDPIVLGVDVLDGILKVGTPICIPQREFIDIGRIASIENNHKPVDFAKKGQKVAIKIVGSNPEEQQKMFGRHFDMEDELVSHITRKSIDILKANYREDLSIDEWRLVVKLKNLFKIQ